MDTMKNIDHSAHMNHSEHMKVGHSKHMDHMNHTGHMGMMNHTGHMGMMNHTGHMGMMNHTGHMNMMNQTGHMNMMNHTGHMNMMNHTGHVNMMNHTGHMSMMNHTGHSMSMDDHSSHSGHMMDMFNYTDHSGHIDHSAHGGHMDMHHNHSDHVHTMHHHPGAMDHSQHTGQHPGFFTLDADVPFLFESWRLDTKTGMFFAVVLIVVLAVVFQAVKSVRQYVHRDYRLNKRTIKSREHFLQTILYLVQILSSYILMLAIMTYNLWVVIATVSGIGVGYFLCAYAFSKKRERRNCAEGTCSPSCSDGRSVLKGNPNSEQELEPLQGANNGGMCDECRETDI
ncbi:hypothetical protein FSP39_022443 [Pinctada imbricata]|uniref:Copper transport protein n=1 Tax=Pinctada imbricata TaxID=66713 RepID=A0AA88XUA9_PINIB|nr:hypothetical protein FSP39_022443 [Pinctada imbricata]